MRRRGETFASPKRIDYECWWCNRPPSLWRIVFPPLDSFFSLHGDRKTIPFTLLSRRKSDELLTFTCNVNHCEFSFCVYPHVFPRATTRERIHGVHFRRETSDEGARGMILPGSFLSSVDDVPGRGRFLNLSFAYREDERENGVDGTHKRKWAKAMRRSCCYWRGKKQLVARRDATRDATRCTRMCEFIAKTGFLAAARENNRQIANNRKLSFPQTPGLRWCAIKLRMH